MTLMKFKKLEDYLFVEGDYKEFTKFINYKVDDLVGNLKDYDGVPTIIVLESPHFDEIRFANPASGATGKKLAHSYINNDKIAIGKLLEDKKHPNFVICNVSNVPLQIEVMRKRYLNFPDIERKYEDRLKSFELYKISKSTSQEHTKVNELITRITSDFKQRLLSHQKEVKATKIVVYGVTAKRAFESCNFGKTQTNCYKINGDEVKVIFREHPSPINLSKK